MDIVKVILTSLLSVVSLFIIAKLIGHKQISQLDFFDYITGITIGSVAAELATELESPWKPLIAMIIYGLCSVILSFVASRFQRSRKYINGTPTIIMDNGKLYRNNMKKAKIELSEFMLMCRQAGYFNVNDIQTAVFEHNGKLSILPVSDKRPLNPNDMDIKVKPENIQTEIIMDGRILEENLKRRGLDMTWLNKQLAKQGYSKASEIFLGVCDSDNSLYLFEAKEK